MPKYKNEFDRPHHIEQTILKRGGGIVGVIRIKPSSILWKPLGEHQYYCVGLDDFAKWITSPRVGADRTKS